MPDDREKIGIRTANGFYVTAINGGGMGEDANALPIHTDATVVQDWEKFEVNFNDDGTCSILTSAPYWLTAVNGGGVAAQPNSPVATDRESIGPWETFSLEEQEHGIYAFRTPNGNYLTAVNGGGMATEGAPLQTNEAGDPSPFQYFILVPVKDDEKGEPPKNG
jgi:hypothetical protein